MKYFMIRYEFKNGPREEWHEEIRRFIAALDSDPAVAGKITYRALKTRDGESYLHLASAVDEEAAKVLGEQPFFEHYTERTEFVSADGVDVVPLELIAATKASP